MTVLAFSCSIFGGFKFDADVKGLTPDEIVLLATTMLKSYLKHKDWYALEHQLSNIRFEIHDADLSTEIIYICNCKH